MRIPVDTHQGPPGGWSYQDPRNQVVYRDNSVNALIERVRRSWKANGIEIPPDYRDVILSEMCAQHPSWECREKGEEERHLTMADIARFGETVKNWIASGASFVDPKEADRRAVICSTCQYNKPVKACMGCSRAVSWLAERVGWPQTRLDPKLQGCVLCGCLTKLKVHIPLGVISNDGIPYPDHCWQRLLDGRNL